MRRSGKVDRVLGSIMGHEVAGRVAAVGPGLRSLHLGDRIASTQRQSCHRCRHCFSGREVLCMEGKLYGEALDGGYAEYCVMDELSLARIPDNVSFDDAAIAACAIGTGYHALLLSGVKPGQRVLVTGASGGIGIHALQLARSMGAEVIAVTSSRQKVDRLRLYADEVLVAEHGTFHREIRNRELQPDVVLDVTAHVTLDSSLRSVQRGGTVVVVGNVENKLVGILPGAFIIRETRLIGSKACSLAELEACLQFLQRGLVQAEIYKSLPLECAQAAHDLLESRAIQGRVVLKP
ncbi:zinc-binding dehydrogenase [Arthrobacter sp. ISL-30]|uniref:zinc-binding dehydrogenase n=1 Tax=Arthrobacter sp. ISL-30 TaxID=2819109 RepID=UPI0035AEBB57